jgi:hypothetical protein
MLDNRISRLGYRLSSRAVVALTALAFAPAGHVLANDRTHRLQGVFCNTEEQVDATLDHMRQALTPRMAVALTNADAVVCNFVDLLHYVVDRPVLIKEIRGRITFFKYEGTLTGVVVGGAVRPLTPPVRVFFVIPDRLADAPLESRA